MPEIIDLYNNARQIVGSADRKTPIPNGLNKLSVHVWFVNKYEQFLLQQGGGATKGETSWDTCVRESMEELGIKPEIEKSVLVGTFKRPNDFVDVWLVHTDTDIKGLKLQASEVQNAKWASAKDIEKMQKDGTFIPSIITGLQMVYNYINMMKKVK